MTKSIIKSSKKSWITICALIFMSIFVVSCGKNQDNIETDPVIPQTEVVNNIFGNLNISTTQGLELACFSIEYPFSLITITGTPILIKNEADFVNIDLNNDKTVADFIYPLNIKKEGVSQQIASIQELAEKFASCIPTSGYSSNNFPAFLINNENNCFSIKYPIVLRDLAGKEYTAQKEVELSDLLAAQDDLFFKWPLTLIRQNNTTVTINSPKELLHQLISCNNNSNLVDSISFDKIGCFDIIYPISFKTTQGIKSAANSAEYIAILLNGNVLDYNYPLKLTSELTGDVIIIYSSDLDLLLSQYCSCGCEGDILFLLTGDPYFNGACYEIQYPIKVKLNTGSDVQMNSDQELEQFVNSTLDNGTLYYPVQVKLISSGQITTFNNFEELFNTLLDCQ